MYQSATFNSAVPTTLELLAETIRDPLNTEEEVAQQVATADYEITEIWSKPELILPELVHMAAYKDNTLGNPLLCPAERLKDINRDVVEAYRKAFYTPERMVVAFAGVDHPTAVRLTEQFFGDMAQSEGPTLSQVGGETVLDSANMTAVTPDSSKITEAVFNNSLTPS
jgi:processing peptidase subunit alpha